MSRRRLLFAGVGVALLAAGLVVWRSGSRGTSGRERSGDPSASTTSKTSARIRAAGASSWWSQRGVSERRVAGRVTFAGRPVDGATVTLVSRGSESGSVPAETVTTGADGAFDFGPEPAAPVTVAAVAAGKTPALVRLDLRNAEVRPPPEALHLELRECAATVHGTVADAGGGPIPGAVVRLGPVAAVAAADGAYALCVPLGEVDLAIGADGYGTITVQLAVSARIRRDFRLSPEGVLTGRAVRAGDGTPVAGALVRVSPSGALVPGLAAAGGSAAAQTTSDVDGRFRLAGLVPGRRQITATASGLRAPASDINVEAGDGDEDIVVSLEAAVQVAGRVVDEARAPVVGALVSLRDPDWSSGADRELHAVSQADGGFVIEDIAPGDYHATVSPHDLDKEPRGRALAVPAAGVAALELVVVRGSSVSGIVTRAGKPVGNARVYLRSGREQARSEPDGRFTLRGVAPGVHELYGESMQEGAFANGPTITVGKGVDVTGVEVELALAGVISGIVVDQNARPVAGAYLSFKLVGGRDFGEATAAEDGTFVTRALSGGGDYSVAIMASRRSSMKFAPVNGDDFPLVAVADGNAQVAGVRYEVQFERLAIAGRVVDEAGAPVADVRVEAHPRGERGSGWGEIAADVTDTDGRFSIADLIAGGYHVNGRAGSGAEAKVAGIVEAGAKDVHLTLATPGAIEGTLSGFTGAPRVAARAMDRGQGVMMNERRAEVSGATFRVRGLAPGRYMIEASAGGLVGDQSTVEVRSRETTRVTLTHRGAGRIVGVVTDDATRAPVAGARCSLRAVSTRARKVVSDDRGRFTIDPASVGEGVVICHGDGERNMGVGRVDVAAGKEASVAVSLGGKAPWEAEARSTIGVAFTKTTRGPRVESLVDGGPAARAGMQLGDVVLGIAGIEGVPFTEVDGSMMTMMIGRFEPGARVTFTLKRGTSSIQLAVVTAKP